MTTTIAFWTYSECRAHETQPYVQPTGCVRVRIQSCTLLFVDFEFHQGEIRWRAVLKIILRHVCHEGSRFHTLGIRISTRRKPRTRVTNIKEYYFCNVRAVRQQFYLIYCLFISYANVNKYVSLFLRYPFIVPWDPAPRSVPNIIHILCIYCMSSFVCVIFMFLLFLF
jgi:hypothetical protein